MKDTLLYVIAAIIICVGGFFAFNNYIYNEKQAPSAVTFKEAPFTISGQEIVLKDGVSEMESAPGSASKTITRYFGNEAQIDLNNDSRMDTVFLVTQETGGSGTQFYLVGSLQTESGFVGSEAVFIGDRIAPQTTEVRDGLVIVNYADRNPGEPMATQPSVGKSLYLKFDQASMQFGEVVQNFEGEADPNTMNLTMKPWTWINAQFNDERVVTPRRTGVFVLTFTADGKVSAATDCNQMSGTYTTGNGTIAFGAMMSTKMYCEGSQEDEFAELLTNTSGYHFTSKGELILDLKFDSGTVLFK
jgi:heat shock protein HslJ